jgi:ubiquilin
MEQNPELRQIMNDPAVMRQSLAAATNPNLRAEMMRNTDRAMANIETMPGGYNALAHMYQTVQAPMMDAAQTPQQHGGDAAPGEGSPTLTNPWASPPSPGVGGTPPSGTPAGSGGNGMAGLGGMAGLAGLGGLGMGGMGGMGGGAPNMEQMQTMMQNPAVQQMTQQMYAHANPPRLLVPLPASTPFLIRPRYPSPAAASDTVRDGRLSNPAMMQQMMRSNPMLQQMMQSNPQVWTIMRAQDIDSPVASRVRCRELTSFVCVGSLQLVTCQACTVLIHGLHYFCQSVNLRQHH